MLVLALPGAQALASTLARRLGGEAAELKLHRFPDGETLVRIDTPVQGRQVVIAGSLDHPDGKLLPLVFAADAARELGATRIGLAAPYLGYMRQDSRFRPGEAVTSRSFARLLSSSVDCLVTVDPHLHRWRSLDEIYTIPTRAVASAPLIAHWLQAAIPHALLVGPDSESEQWVADVARRVGAPWTVLEKTRRGDRDVSVTRPEVAGWRDRTPVLLDDIVSTGHTLVAAADALRQAGLAAPACVAVHALFDAQALAKLRQAGIAQVVTCDTLVHETNAIGVADAVAEALEGLMR